MKIKQEKRKEKKSRVENEGCSQWGSDEVKAMPEKWREGGFGCLSDKNREPKWMAE